MPKPSLCSCARVANPVKLNITSVGTLAFMPRSWHMASRGGVARSIAAPPRLLGGEEKTAHRGVAAQADRARSRLRRSVVVAGGAREVRERRPVRLVRLDVAR